MVIDEEHPTDLRAEIRETGFEGVEEEGFGFRGEMRAVYEDGYAGVGCGSRGIGVWRVVGEGWGSGRGGEGGYRCGIVGGHGVVAVDERGGWGFGGRVRD